MARTKKTTTEPKPRKKTECPVTRQEFADKAKAITAVINGQTVILDAKLFSTGSFGWGANGKVVIMIGDTPVKVQMGINLTVIGSKELPKEDTLTLTVAPTDDTDDEEEDDRPDPEVLAARELAEKKKSA